MVRKIKTAGAEFVGTFLEETLRRYSSFADDKAEKQKFIRDMHDEYGKSREYTFGTTKTKCYALINIIQEGRVLDAIEYVLNSDEKRVPEYAKDNAALLLDAIIRNEIILPNG